MCTLVLMYFLAMWCDECLSSGGFVVETDQELPRVMSTILLYYFVLHALLFVYYCPLAASTFTSWISLNFLFIPQIYNIHGDVHKNHTRLSLQSTQIYMLLLTYTYIHYPFPSKSKLHINTDIHLNSLIFPWVVGTDRYAYKSETGASCACSF